MDGASKPPGYFAGIYREGPDPWGFETRAYEHAKYDATLAALTREHYPEAFEIGCSVGVLTERLAGRCGALLAVDVVPDPLRRARERCRHLPHVRFQQMQVPREFPEQAFDLIALSEVGYYWSAADMEWACELMIERLNPRGQLLLVHWRPVVVGCPLTGDAVHATLARQAAGRLRHLAGNANDCYRLDLYERAGHPSETNPAGSPG